jgi:predicted ATPase
VNQSKHSRRFILAGTSGTGKTALLQGLSDCGFCCFQEPGRKILAAHLAGEGEGFARSFVNLMKDQFISDFEAASSEPVSFYDRGLPDTVAYAIRFGVDAEPFLAVARVHRYETPVFLAPLWPEIFEYDEWRRAPYDDYVRFHEHIVESYRQLGYPLIELPKQSVEYRVSFIMDHIREGA